MKLNIIKTLQEFKRFESEETIGIYEVEITETDFSNGEIIIIKNGNKLQKLTHYSSGTVLESNFTEVFEKELNKTFNIK